MMAVDKLSGDAAQARVIGVSYGKYKALTYDGTGIEGKKGSDRQEKLDAGWIECAWCKSLFRPRNQCNRYCSPDCAKRGWESNHKDKLRRYKKRTGKDRNGEQIPGTT